MSMKPSEKHRAAPAERAGAGRGAGECQRRLPATRHDPDPVLRLQAALRAARPGGAEGPAADPQEPSADHAGRGGRAHPGAEPGASGLGLLRLEAHLKLDGVSVSSPTIQSILIKHEMGTEFQRLLKLEERPPPSGFELTAEQIRPIEKANPASASGTSRAAIPASCWPPTRSSSAPSKGVGKVYLHTVVDTYGSPMPSASCTPPRCPRPPSRRCTTSVALLPGARHPRRRASSPTTAASSAAPRPIPTRSIWPSTALSTGAPRSAAPRPTASSNASSAQPRRSSSSSRSARPSTSRSRRYRRTSTPG